MKRFFGAVLAVAAVIAAIDMILHNVVLLDAYKQTMALWRSEAEMKDLFWLIWAGYPVFALFFVWIFAKGYEKEKPGFGQGLRFGILAGLLVFAASNMMCYAVMPLPAAIPVAWFLGGMVECIAGGVVAGMIYKP
ncbi:MAG: hypothetical protein WC530_04550 [Candidatus Omnitrophota bacterium]|jgi:hypothetical protein